MSKVESTIIEHTCGHTSSFEIRDEFADRQWIEARRRRKCPGCIQRDARELAERQEREKRENHGRINQVGDLMKELPLGTAFRAERRAGDGGEPTWFGALHLPGGGAETAHAKKLNRLLKDLVRNWHRSEIARQVSGAQPPTIGATQPPHRR